MRKPIYLTGTCALFVAVAIFVWSQNALVFSRTTTPAMSPTEMMTDFKKPAAH